MTVVATVTPEIGEIGYFPREVERVGGLPVIQPGGIRWTGGDGRKPLRIALDFENPRDEPTRPVSADLQVADFGAFRPWQPLTTVAVPSIPPRARREVATTANASPDPATSQQLLDVLRARNIPDSARARFQRFLGQNLMMQSFLELQMELRSEQDVHFVGNINVFVDKGRPVERHVRQQIGLRPGCRNYSAFFVGNGVPDTYTFDIRACEPGWRVELQGAAQTGEAVVLHRPMNLARAMVHACITPRNKAESGGVVIEVKRASCKSTALVEFELETTNLGSKCYFL